MLISFLSCVSSSLVLDIYKKIVDDNRRFEVNEGCYPDNQWEVARLMAGLIRKKEADLTDEEKTKVNADLEEQGYRMCSLRKELYCVEDPSSIYVGSCKACKDLESEPLGIKFKDQNREFCKHAAKIAKAPKAGQDEEEKDETTTTPVPRTSSSSPSISLNGTLLPVLLVITIVLVLKLC